MTALQTGAKVITASALSPSHWTTGELARRKPGTEGVIEVVLASPKEDSSCARCYDHGAYLVKHAAGLEAQYHGDELIPVRKRAGLEQPSDVEERLSKLEAQHSRSLDAMARELAGLENQLEHYWDRLRALEQRDSRRAADKLEAEAAVAAARPWCEVHELERRRLGNMLRHTSRPLSHAADALEAVPDLVAAATVRPSELQALRALRRAARDWWDEHDRLPYGVDPELSEIDKRLQDALQAFDELDDGEEQSSPYAGVHDDSSLIPEVPAPPPSDACREIERLQEELAQAHADVDLLTAQRDIAQRRNARAFETLREFDLRAGCNLINDAADDAVAQLRQTAEAVRDLTGAPETVSLHDALEAARWQTEEYGNAESALRAELGGTAGLADLAKEAVIQIRGGTAGILLYRRLSDPEAYDETDLDKLAAAALIARTSQRKQAEVLSDLRDIFGADEAGFGLRELAVRAVLHAQPVERLLKTYNAVEIDGCRGGLVSLTAPLPPHTVARGIADMLAEVVALAEGERATDRHAAGCADVRCKGCAPPTQSKR